MSRSGYVEFDGEDPLAEGRWKAMLRSALRGKRGRTFLRDLRDALDALPIKELIASELKDADGAVCAIGSVGVYRGIDMSSWIKPADYDEEEWAEEWECDAQERADALGTTFDIASCLAQEVMSVNDDHGPHDETPAQRWTRVRRWVERKLTGGAWNALQWPIDGDGREVAP